MATRAQVVVGSALGLAVGLVGGYFLHPAPRPILCPPLPEPEFPVGHYYVIGDDIYVDEGFVRWLASRVTPERSGSWLIFRLRDLVIHLADLRRVPWHFYIQGQIGRRFLVRTEEGEGSDREVIRFLEALVSLGVLAEGGRWGSWDELSPRGAGEGKEGDDGEDA